MRRRDLCEEVEVELEVGGWVWYGLRMDGMGWVDGEGGEEDEGK
jgi:hypothetical protein